MWEVSGTEGDRLRPFDRDVTSPPLDVVAYERFIILCPSGRAGR